MGGDHGPSVTVPACLAFLQNHDDAVMVLVGQQDVIEKELTKHRSSHLDRIEIVHADETVSMDESPALALKHKKKSSMRIAINLVKEGSAACCVSAGTTGALMATAKFVLKTLPGIDRPAIATIIPTQTGHNYMLDLGANVDCTPEHLLQFGVMGSLLASAVDHKDLPRVGLLNIGHEEGKGGEVVRRAWELLSAAPIHFIGNIEGDDLFKDKADVIVCDGFVGNIALKTSEGLARMITGILKEEFARSWFSKAIALIALPVLKAIKRRLDGRQYNGANLLGLKGIVIKSHGSADLFAFQCALEVAYRTASSGLLERITADMAAANAALGIITTEFSGNTQ
jgi:glycerol-3-phosphate acyltransferase PlsX